MATNGRVYPFSHQMFINHSVYSRNRMYPLYLDFNRETPIDPNVLSAVDDYIVNTIRSPILNATKDAIIEARDNIANMIAAKRDEIIFTSCFFQTMFIIANSAEKAFHNWCKREFPEREKVKAHVISSMVEPAETIDFFHRYAREHDIDLTLVPVSKTNGCVSMQDVLSAMVPSTCLISISCVVPATGILQPLNDIRVYLEEIGACKRFYRPLLHSDISNALGKMEVNVKSLSLDYASLLGNKIYAPNISALYYNKEVLQKKTYAEEIFCEKELKAKIENVSFVVGLGQAALLISNHYKKYEEHLLTLKKYFEDELISVLGDQIIILNKGKTICNVSCVMFINPDAFERLMAANMLCPNIEAARSGEFLNILKESGIPYDLAKQTLSISFGRNTTEAELSKLVRNIGTTLI